MCKSLYPAYLSGCQIKIKCWCCASPLLPLACISHTAVSLLARGAQGGGVLAATSSIQLSVFCCLPLGNGVGTTVGGHSAACRRHRTAIDAAGAAGAGPSAAATGSSAPADDSAAPAGDLSAPVLVCRLPSPFVWLPLSITTP